MSAERLNGGQDRRGVAPSAARPSEMDLGLGRFYQDEAIRAANTLEIPKGIEVALRIPSTDALRLSTPENSAVNSGDPFVDSLAETVLGGLPNKLRPFVSALTVIGVGTGADELPLVALRLTLHDPDSESYFILDPSRYGRRYESIGQAQGMGAADTKAMAIGTLAAYDQPSAEHWERTRQPVDLVIIGRGSDRRIFESTAAFPLQELPPELLRHYVSPDEGSSTAVFGLNEVDSEEARMLSDVRAQRRRPPSSTAIADVVRQWRGEEQGELRRFSLLRALAEDQARLALEERGIEPRQGEKHKIYGFQVVTEGAEQLLSVSFEVPGPSDRSEPRVATMLLQPTVTPSGTIALSRGRCSEQSRSEYLEG